MSESYPGDLTDLANRIFVSNMLPVLGASEIDREEANNSVEVLLQEMGGSDEVVRKLTEAQNS